MLRQECTKSRAWRTEFSRLPRFRGIDCLAGAQRPLAGRIRLVHRLAYNGDVAAGQLAVFQGGPSRTGGKAPISESYGSSEQRGSQLAPAQRIALTPCRRPILKPVGYPSMFCSLDSISCPTSMSQPFYTRAQKRYSPFESRLPNSRLSPTGAHAFATGKVNQ